MSVLKSRVAARAIPLRILVVEDNDDHATLILRGLERAKIESQVQRVDHGQSALEYLRGDAPFGSRVKPDLVLLDINLPGQSGHSVLAGIRADKELALTPVIMVSTSDNDEDVRTAYQQHANAYVVKPHDFSELCVLINDLLAFWGRWNVSL